MNLQHRFWIFDGDRLWLTASSRIWADLKVAAFATIKPNLRVLQLGPARHRA